MALNDEKNQRGLQRWLQQRLGTRFAPDGMPTRLDDAQDECATTRGDDGQKDQLAAGAIIPDVGDGQKDEIPAGAIIAAGDDDQTDPFATDPIITKLKPPLIDDDVVTFRGWLGPLQDGRYKLFTSRGLARWLEIPEAALLYQLPGKKQRDRDAFSIVWVKHEARLIECHRAKACQLVDADFQFDGDPTEGRPKYGGG